jgi:hypothetical protein
MYRSLVTLRREGAMCGPCGFPRHGCGDLACLVDESDLLLVLDDGLFHETTQPFTWAIVACVRNHGQHCLPCVFVDTERDARPNRLRTHGPLRRTGFRGPSTGVARDSADNGLVSSLSSSVRFRRTPSRGRKIAANLSAALSDRLTSTGTFNP